MHKIHDDIAREEDDPTTRGPCDRAAMHVDQAMAATRKTIVDAERGM